MSAISQSLESIEVNVQYETDLEFLMAEKKEILSPENWRKWSKVWLNSLKENLPPASGYEFTLRLSDDTEIQSLNHQYRFKDQPTDVLAFASLEIDFPVVEDGDPLYLGDIIISLETAQKKAISQGHSLETEVIWLTSHGLLHLLGWDHPDEDRLEEMLSRQETLLNLIGISHPLR